MIWPSLGGSGLPGRGGNPKRPSSTPFRIKSGVGLRITAWKQELSLTGALPYMTIGVLGARSLMIWASSDPEIPDRRFSVIMAS